MAFDLDQFIPKDEEEEKQSSFDLDQFIPKAAPEPEVETPEPTPFEERAAEPAEPAPEHPTDLSDFGVTPEQMNAPAIPKEGTIIPKEGMEPEPERSYTQQYNDETVRLGKQRLNEDGTTSTVFSKTGQLDGKWYNVPGFDRDTGKDHESDDAAIEAARADIEAGKVTPYDTAEEATAAATEEHKELEPVDKLDATITKLPFADPKDARFDWFANQLAKEGQDIKEYRESLPDEAVEDVPGWWEGRWGAFAGKQNRWMAGLLEGFQNLGDFVEGDLAGMEQDPADRAKGDETIRILKERADRLEKVGEETKARAMEGAEAVGGALTSAVTMYGTDVIDGAANMLPSIVTAKIGGANLGLAEMGLQVWGDTYSRAKDEGLDSVEAFYRAVRSTAYEIGPEKLFGYFDKLGGAGMRDWAMQALREGASEVLTSVLEQADEVWMQGEAWEGWEKATKRAGYDFLVGLGMGGALSANMAFKTPQEELPAPPDDPTKPPDDPDGPDSAAAQRANIESMAKHWTHEDLMLHPMYKKFYDSSDLGENSASEEDRRYEAREAWKRKAIKMGKWDKILEEADAGKKDEPAEEGSEAAAVVDRREYEDKKDDDGPDGPPPPASAGTLIDPTETFQTNIDGKIKEYSLDEATKALENPELDKTEREQLQEQLDIEQQRTEEEESLDDPRSEEREDRPLNINNAQYEDVTPDTLFINAELMQYKSDTDVTGRSKLLKGVKKWDSALSGLITAWEDINGNRIVADGHQRVNLLNELIANGTESADTTLHARVYKESEGYSAKDVRTIASIINIAEGSGTAVDAAKVLRDMSEEAAADAMQKLPVNSALVRNAKGLAKLGEEAFQVVVNDMIDQTYGAMIGEAFEETEQSAAMQIFIKSKPSSIDEAHAMIADIQAGGFVESEQGGLFGESEQESLIKERAQIITASEKKLRKNAAVFNTLVKEEGRVTEEGKNVLDTESNKEQVEQARSVIDRALTTINTNEELNSELNRIAKEYKSGSITKTGAVNAFIKAATAYTERSSGESVARDGVDGRREEAAEAVEVTEPKDQAPEEAPEVKAEEKPKKTPAQITLTEDVQVEETGEIVTIEENAAQALLRIDERISIVERLRDCILS